MDGLEVVPVEVVATLLPSLVLDVGGAEVDPGPDARVDVLPEYVGEAAGSVGVASSRRGAVDRSLGLVHGA